MAFLWLVSMCGETPRYRAMCAVHTLHRETAAMSLFALAQHLACQEVHSSESPYGRRLKSRVLTLSSASRSCTSKPMLHCTHDAAGKCEKIMEIRMEIIILIIIMIAIMK